MPRYATLTSSDYMPCAGGAEKGQSGYDNVPEPNDNTMPGCRPG